MCSADFSHNDYFKIFIKTKSKKRLEMIVRFASDRMFNRPMDRVSLKNLPKTLEVYIPKAIYFGGIEVPKDYHGPIETFYCENGGIEALVDYIEDVKSFYCEHGNVEKGIELVIDDIISICNAIC